MTRCGGRNGEGYQQKPICARNKFICEVRLFSVYGHLYRSFTWYLRDFLCTIFVHPGEQFAAREFTSRYRVSLLNFTVEATGELSN